MVRLDRIYTRSGDSGQTSLGDGSRVDKTSLRVVAMGAVDELNCQLGVAVSGVSAAQLRELLIQLQQLLFDLGADLCSPLPAEDKDDSCRRIAPQHTRWLEARIDEIVDQLQPLTSFILPGGQPGAAALHLSRAICRRAEIGCRMLMESDSAARINSEIPVFLNRLSDLLFVLARQANNSGTDDILWTPGAVDPRP